MTLRRDPANLVSISNSLEPLKAAFNSAKDKPRLAILVSPTCAMCLQGAEAAFEIIGKSDVDPSLDVLFIWINMLPADSFAEAVRQAGRMANPRIRHFHDGAQLAGKAVAATLGGRNRTAWDIYMIFPPGVLWGESAPRPRTWVHQIPGELWANPLRFRTGRILKRALSGMIRARAKPDPSG